MSSTDNIHPLRLPEPRTKAGKSATLAEIVSRLMLEGRKIDILNPREGEARHEVLQLSAAGDDYRCPACGMRGTVAHNHMPGQELDREEAAPMAASLEVGERADEAELCAAPTCISKPPALTKPRAGIIGLML